jgi:hypothetical protein
MLSIAVASSSGLRLHGSTEQGQAENHLQVAHKELQRRLLLDQTPQLQELVVCNAYASPKPLDIVQVRIRQSLTDGNPLAYKQCKKFSLPLEEGDQLDFKAGNLDVGTFYATGLPKSSASLLLIPQRRSPHAVGVSFKSHAFANVQNPQIAVIDAYDGKSGKNTESVKLMENLADHADKTEEQIEEELKYNSIVAVNPGKYLVSLSGAGRRGVALNAASSTKYVVMRIGTEDAGVQSGHFPQELIIFPNGGFGTALPSSVMLLAIFVGMFGL